MSIVESSESFVNYSRNKLISKCDEILSERRCSNCGMKGRYAIWSIYCGDHPKQIHIQLTKSTGNLKVDIWDENHNHLNHRLQQLPFTDPLCKLLSRAILQLYNELNHIVSNSQNAINASIKEGIGGDRFYIIYEEAINFELSDYSKLGDIVFVENNFNYMDLYKLSSWIEENHVF
jgi:hypothetical protein